MGESNEKFVEVRAGLTEGESVVLDARARSNAETQGGAEPRPEVQQEKNQKSQPRSL